MCQGKVSPAVRREIDALSTSYASVIELPWMLAAGSTILRVIDEMRQESGGLTQAPRYRFASVRTSEPGAWSTGTARSANGIGVTDVDVSATINQMWIQAALAAKYAGSVASAYSMIQASVDSGSVLLSQTVEVPATILAEQDVYIPLGAPVAAMGLTKLMFATTVSGVTGTVAFQPAWRVFQADKDNPSAWVDLGSVKSTVAATSHNFGLLSTTTTANMWFQPGIRIDGGSSSANDGRGTIKIVVAAKF